MKNDFGLNNVIDKFKMFNDYIGRFILQNKIVKT